MHGTLFDDERMSMADALEQTRQSLLSYGQHYRHWAIAYSGGKDSTCVLAVVLRLLRSGAVPPPESLTVLYADTRMELPPLQESAMATLQAVRGMGYNAVRVLPELDNRFMVYMLGRGVPPPSNTFRWCTERIKIRPMLHHLRSLRDSCGEKLLMLTGVRLGESAARDKRISLSCSRDKGECGQGWFTESTPESVADTLAPLLHWRVCHVWDWLAVESPKDGLATQTFAQVYDADLEGSANEAAARTGCVGCNLASQDFSLQRILKRPEWSHLEPLRRLKPLYALLKDQSRRLRKAGELRADGSPAVNQGRLGPLTFEARLWGLEQVLEIQADINMEAGRLDREEYYLIDFTEQTRIRELIAAETWPQGWSGEEPVGDSLDYDLFRDGTIQSRLF